MTGRASRSPRTGPSGGVRSLCRSVANLGYSAATPRRAGLNRPGVPSPGELPYQPEDDHGPHKGDADGPDVHPCDARVSKVAEEPPAHDGADDPDQQISQETPGSVPRHDHPGQPPGDDPDDNPCQNTHLTISPLRRAR